MGGDSFSDRPTTASVGTALPDPRIPGSRRSFHSLTAMRPPSSSSVAAHPNGTGSWSLRPRGTTGRASSPGTGRSRCRHTSARVRRGSKTPSVTRRCSPSIRVRSRHRPPDSHFTRDLLHQLAKKGVATTKVTLHRRTGDVRTGQSRQPGGPPDPPRVVRGNSRGDET